MENRLRKLLANEDRRNPLTDQELAEKLRVNRAEVTLLRKRLEIPNSRERREVQLQEDAALIVKREPGISARALGKELQVLGYRLSRHVAARLLLKLKSREDNAKDASRPRAFLDLIGWQGSLKMQIEQAKAAVLYPSGGLHTLILGESGVGKSKLAEAMYHYSVEMGIRSTSSPFIVFNCADYAENPQLLLSQLFGHVKGSFTGAVDNKTGLVEKADEGFLFLDEVHRLPPEGQEILYSIIDRGTYRKLGETENSRRVNILLIAATTESLESSLLTPFRRRIPMVIELPPLRTRPVSERVDIVKHFFHEEANRVKKPLIVRRDVIKALLSGNKPGNVGQLKSDVQVACARGFLNHFGDHLEDRIIITLNELPRACRHSLLEARNSRELDNMLPQDVEFWPTDDGQISRQLHDNIYTLPNEIYDRIEKHVNECRKEGLSADETSKRVSQELEGVFSRVIRRIENVNPAISRADLESIVGSQISNTVAEMVEIAADELGIKNEQLFFCLAIHLNTALERLMGGKPIVNLRISHVRSKYQEEYLTAIKMAAVVKRRFGIRLPEDEVGFLALYLVPGEKVGESGPRKRGLKTAENRIK